MDARTRLGWIRLYERVGNAGLVAGLHLDRAADPLFLPHPAALDQLQQAQPVPSRAGPSGNRGFGPAQHRGHEPPPLAWTGT